MSWLGAFNFSSEKKNYTIKYGNRNRNASLIHSYIKLRFYWLVIFHFKRIN